MEAWNIIILLFTFIVGVVSTAYPNESLTVAKLRCIGLIVSSCILFIFTCGKMWIDRVLDRALCLNYIDKREGGEVTY